MPSEGPHFHLSDLRVSLTGMEDHSEHGFSELAKMVAKMEDAASAWVLRLLVFHMLRHINKKPPTHYWLEYPEDLRTGYRLELITKAYNALHGCQILETTENLPPLAIDDETDHEAFKYNLGAIGIALLGLIS